MGVPHGRATAIVSVLAMAAMVLVVVRADLGSELVYGCEPEWDWQGNRVGAFVITGADQSCSYYSRNVSTGAQPCVAGVSGAVEVSGSCTQNQVCVRDAAGFVTCTGLPDPDVRGPFHHITVGYNFACGLLALPQPLPEAAPTGLPVGIVYCWPPTVAPAIQSGTLGVQVASYAQASHVCVLSAAGDVQCYGATAPIAAGPTGFFFRHIGTVAAAVYNVPGRVCGIARVSCDVDSVVCWGDLPGPKVTFQSSRFVNVQMRVGWNGQWYAYACAVEGSTSDPRVQSSVQCDGGDLGPVQSFPQPLAALSYSYGPTFGVDAFGELLWAWWINPQQPVVTIPGMALSRVYSAACAAPSPNSASVLCGGQCALGWAARDYSCLCA